MSQDACGTCVQQLSLQWGPRPALIHSAALWTQAVIAADNCDCAQLRQEAGLLPLNHCAVLGLAEEVLESFLRTACGGYFLPGQGV